MVTACSSHALRRCIKIDACTYRQFFQASRHDVDTVVLLRYRGIYSAVVVYVCTNKEVQCKAINIYVSTAGYRHFKPLSCYNQIMWHIHTYTNAPNVPSPETPTSPNFGFVYKTNSDDYRHPKLDILHKYLSTMIKKTKITYIRYGSHAVISPGMAD